MPSTYPNSVDTFTTKVDGVTAVSADHVNKLQDAVVKIETEIGLSAKGDLASLSERLDVAINPDGTITNTALENLPLDSLDGGVLVDESVPSDKIESLDYAKLTGVPATSSPSTHAASHENGGGDELALDASQVTSGTVDTARLGSGTPTATKFLRGDQTWNPVDYTDLTNTPSFAAETHAASHENGGGDEVALDASQITTGTMDPSRLGSGSPTANNVLRGDSSWGGLPAAALLAHATTHEDGGSDELALNAAQITAGTVDTARLGSGAASAATFLRGDQTWATPTGAGLTAPVIGTLTPPDDGDFAWINQGAGPDSSTLTQADGVVTLRANAVAGDNLRIRKKTLAYNANGDYTIVFGFIPEMVTNGNFPSMGLALRESGTGKLVTMAWTKNGADDEARIRIQKWTSPTAFSAGYLSDWEDSALMLRGPILYFAIDLQDAFDLYRFWVSNDGKYFTKIGERAQANFFTTGADEVGFYACANTANSGAIIHACHFAEYNTAIPVTSTVINF